MQRRHSWHIGMAFLMLWQPAFAGDHAKGSGTGGRGENKADPAIATQAIEVMAGKLFSAMPAECRGKNLGVSPFNLATALVPVLLGGDKKLKAEFATLLGLSGPEKIPDFLGSFANLNQELASSAKGKDGKPLFTNAALLMADQKETYKRAFYDAVGKYVGADVHNSPFSAELGAKIDQWVAGKTNNRITKIAPDPMPSDGLIIVSASAFNMPWETPFDKEMSHEKWHFKTADGKNIEVPAMDGRITTAQFFQPKDADVAELEYGTRGDQRWRAQVMMKMSPQKGGAKPKYPTNFSLAEKLGTEEGIEKVKLTAKDQYRGTGVTIRLPRIEMDSDSSACVKKALQAVIPSAFSGGVSEALYDFAGRITSLGHKQYIKVNEEGTEAAAATSIGLSRGGGGLPPGTLHFNEPYVFVVRGPSGVPVFVQIVEDPSKKK